MVNLVAVTNICPASGIVYVDADATTGANNGTNWANAFTDLQDALELACGCDNSTNPRPDIWVADGIYRPSVELDFDGLLPGGDPREVTFQLCNDVAIYGGFTGWSGGASGGSEETMLAQRNDNPATNNTVLSGDLNGDDLAVATDQLLSEATRNENAYHVVSASGTNSTAILDGFTISGGNATEAMLGGENNRRGAGIYNDAGSPTLRNLRLVENAATEQAGGMLNINAAQPIIDQVNISGNLAQFGGGMYNNTSNPTITNATFDANLATESGGGMFNLSGASPTIEEVNFSNNEAPSGGGMLNSGVSNPQLNRVTFQENRATNGDGGGMVNLASSPTLTECTFTENTATEDGGGMYNLTVGADEASPILSNDSEFISNSARNGGGMANRNGANPVLTDCDFTENTATESGGGMFNSLSNPVLTDCTFDNNDSEEDGGGVTNQDQSAPVFNNCVFTGNTAQDDGGAMYNRDESTPFIVNGQFIANRVVGDGGAAVDNNNAMPVFINSLFSGNATVSGGIAGNDANGGAIRNVNNSSAAFTNCTFSGNYAENQGGAIFNDNSNIELINVIIWNNQDQSGTGTANASIVNNNGTLSITFSLIQNITTAVNNNLDGITDAANANYPEFIIPVTPDPNATTLGDLRLEPTSPAVDAGDNSVVTVPPFLDNVQGNAIDLDGNPRLLGAAVDFGPYETGRTTITIVKEVLPASINIGDNAFDILLNGQVVIANAVDGSSFGPETVVAGVTQSISEVAAATTNTNLNDYCISITCVDENNLPLAVAQGPILVNLVPDFLQNITCTITNILRPTAEAGEDKQVCLTKSVTLSDASFGGSATEAAWSILSEPVVGAGQLSDTNPTANPETVIFSATAPSRYVLQLTTDSPDDCEPATDTVIIDVKNVNCGTFPWAGEKN